MLFQEICLQFLSECFFQSKSVYSYEVEPTTITVKKLLVKKNHI